MRAFRVIFGRLAATRSISGYMMFVKSAWKLPQVQACKGIALRGKMMGKLYQALPASERESLAKQGKLVKPRPKAPKRPRKPSPFSLFVKKYFNDHRKQMLAIPFKNRLKLIAAEYKKLNPTKVVA